MKAIIYKPTKNVMQSGRGRDSGWVLRYDIGVTRRPEPLNGWTSADSTLGQVRLHFDSLERARAYVDAEGLDYTVQSSVQRKVRPRNYGDNFKYQPFEEGDE